MPSPSICRCFKWILSITSEKEFCAATSSQWHWWPQTAIPPLMLKNPDLSMWFGCLVYLFSTDVISFRASEPPHIGADQCSASTCPLWASQLRVKVDNTCGVWGVRCAIFTLPLPHIGRVYMDKFYLTWMNLSRTKVYTELFTWNLNKSIPQFNRYIPPLQTRMKIHSGQAGME